MNPKQNETMIIIPARKNSTRFPNKPFALIAKQALLERVWRIAKAVHCVDCVYIATDSLEIQRFAENFGAQVLLTPSDCENGTERVYQAIQTLSSQKTPSLVINLQGDAVLTPPWVIQAVVDAMQKDPSIQIATPASPLNWENYDTFLKSKETGSTSGTCVVFDQFKNALYFSKSIIPFIRDRENTPECPFYKHIGLYGYRIEALEIYSKLKATTLEKAEKLEQLRALENGIPIRIIPVDTQKRTQWPVDNPEDISIVEKIIQSEGELIVI